MCVGGGRVCVCVCMWVCVCVYVCVCQKKSCLPIIDFSYLLYLCYSYIFFFSRLDSGYRKFIMRCRHTGKKVI